MNLLGKALIKLIKEGEKMKGERKNGRNKIMMMMLGQKRRRRKFRIRRKKGKRRCRICANFYHLCNKS